MNLKLEVGLSQEAKREIARPMAELLGLVVRPVFWASLALLVVSAPLLLLVLDAWGVIAVTVFMAILLAVLRLGVWHPCFRPAC